MSEVIINNLCVFEGSIYIDATSGKHNSFLLLLSGYATIPLIIFFQVEPLSVDLYTPLPSIPTYIILGLLGSIVRLFRVVCVFSNVQSMPTSFNLSESLARFESSCSCISGTVSIDCG